MITSRADLKAAQKEDIKTMVKAVLWDLDHTLFAYDQAMIDACDLALAKAALRQGVPLSLSEAFKIATQAEIGYAKFIRDYPDIINQVDFHADFHRLIDETGIRPFYDLPDALTNLNDVQNIVITHSHNHWAERVLNHLGIREHFAEDIYDFGAIGYVPKSRNEDIFDHIAQKQGLDTSDFAMVEDTPENLKIAKDKGMTTILVHNNEDKGEIPDYVDYVVENAVEAVKLISSGFTLIPAYHQSKPGSDQTELSRRSPKP